MSDLSEAWLTCTSSISRRSSISPGTWNRSLSVLCAGGMGQPLGIWAVRLFEKQIKSLSERLESVAAAPKGTEGHVCEIIASVHKEFQEMRTTIEDLENELCSQRPGITRRFLLNSRAIMETRVPSSFQSVVYRLLSNSSAEGQKADSREQLSALMNKSDDSHTLCVQLVDLGFTRMVEDAVIWVVFETIDELVSERTEGQIETRALPTLWQWVDEFVVPWISIVLPDPTISNAMFSPKEGEMDTTWNTEDERGRQLRQWRKRLAFHLHSSVGRIRIRQMLHLIDQFPTSLPALEDLKDCIRSTDLKPVVTTALRGQFTQKMLNAGTMTSDILKQYVNMIRALRFLDPSDVILESVSDPVHEYLRRRPDTVRCIVSDMTGDGELYQELERGRIKRMAEEDEGLEVKEMQYLSRTTWEQDEDDLLSIDGDLDANLRFDLEAYKNWQPEPIDAPARGGKWRSGGDAITTLVAIYGSSAQIVNEYKGLLADKLSTHLEVDIKREARVLQLLTERFGRETMHDCDIMLRDFADSVDVERELSPDVQDQLQSFETTIISKEFWPRLVEEPSFKAMPELERQMALFEKSYKELKEPRMLRWQRSLGAVALKLDFEDGRKVEVTVSPIQATILHHFGEQKRQTLKELQSKLGVDDENFVRRKVQALTNQGFLRAVAGTNTVYETVERGGDVDVAAAAMDDELGDIGMPDGGDGGGEEVEMAVYQSYVMAMLQNLKQLPLEQIHSMLQRFVQTPVYDKTQAQLAAFLARLVAEGKVELSAGMYRVKSKPNT